MPAAVGGDPGTIDVEIDPHIAECDVACCEIVHRIDVECEAPDAGRRVVDVRVDPPDAPDQRDHAFVIDHLGAHRHHARQVEVHQALHHRLDLIEARVVEAQGDALQRQVAVGDGRPGDHHDAVPEKFTAPRVGQLGQHRVEDRAGIERHAGRPGLVRLDRDRGAVHRERGKLELEVLDSPRDQHARVGAEAPVRGRLDHDPGPPPAAVRAQQGGYRRDRDSQ